MEAIAATSLAFVSLQFLVSVAVSAFLVRKRNDVSMVDKLLVLWLVFDAVVHFTLEGPFVYLSVSGTMATSDSFLSVLWREYAKADSRWGVADPTIVTLEIWTVFLNGSMCVMLVYAVLFKKPYRHFIQTVLNVCELYGGWMTFGPEWLTGSANLDTSSFLFLWVYLFFFNFLWVIIPLLMLLQSFMASISVTNKKHVE